MVVSIFFIILSISTAAAFSPIKSTIYTHTSTSAIQSRSAFRDLYSYCSSRMGVDAENIDSNVAMKRPFSSLSSTATHNTDTDTKTQVEPLYLEEGLFAVEKPLGWTSQDVVGKIRRVLENDGIERGAPDSRTKRRRPWMKVGHGGTLDPLATGVLVVGVGSGTKDLQKYLTGSKAYRAEVTLGYQTTTLDSDPKADIVARAKYDHVTSYTMIEDTIKTKFIGKIQQTPPIFSALKRDGKKLYELGRKGQTAEDIEIPSREVQIYQCGLVKDSIIVNKDSDEPIAKFVIDVECGGGTYIRSLVRDIAIELGTVATMTKLERTKQGMFKLKHCISYQLNQESEKDIKDCNSDSNGTVDRINKKEDCNWTVETIVNNVRSSRKLLESVSSDGLIEIEGDINTKKL